MSSKNTRKRRPATRKPKASKWEWVKKFIPVIEQIAAKTISEFVQAFLRNHLK